MKIANTRAVFINLNQLTLISYARVINPRFFCQKASSGTAHFANIFFQSA